MRDSSAAASGWSGTGWATSRWSGTGRSTRGWSGTGWSTTGRATRVAAALANLAATNLAATNLGQAELRHLEAVRLLAAAIATRVASWGTGRDRSGTARSTRSGSSTARSWSGTRSGGTATAVAAVVEQAGIGAVDAGKTNQRGGHPYKFHLRLSYRSGAVEREGLSSTQPDTLSGGLDISLDTRFASLPKFSDRASYSTQSNDFDLKRCGDCETTCRLYRLPGVNSPAAQIVSLLGCASLMSECRRRVRGVFGTQRQERVVLTTMRSDDSTHPTALPTR